LLAEDDFYPPPRPHPPYTPPPCTPPFKWFPPHGPRPPGCACHCGTAPCPLHPWAWIKADVDLLPPDPILAQNGFNYKESIECAWREELLDLMAEQREEMSWERHNGYTMPEFEKGGFRYKDPAARKEQMDKLEDLLTQAKLASLQRARLRAS
jgi:hypothetical protein